MIGLGDRVIFVAKNLVGLREATGHNDGPWIDQMLDYLGLPHHLSWCLAFVLYCYHVAVNPIPFPKIARCSLFWEQIQQNEWKYKVYTAEDAAWGIVKAEAGDVMIFAHSPTPGNKNWNGHAALVVKQITPRRWGTVEGNSNVKGSREGDGVYLNERGIKNGTLLLEGIVRPR